MADWIPRGGERGEGRSSAELSGPLDRRCQVRPRHRLAAGLTTARRVHHSWSCFRASAASPRRTATRIPFRNAIEGMIPAASSRSRMESIPAASRLACAMDASISEPKVAMTTISLFTGARRIVRGAGRRACSREDGRVHCTGKGDLRPSPTIDSKLADARRADPISLGPPVLACSLRCDYRSTISCRTCLTRGSSDRLSREIVRRRRLRSVSVRAMEISLSVAARSELFA